MSLSRINRIIHKVLPFNYGMDYGEWLSIYDKGTRFLCPEDPRNWTPEEVAEVNRTAAEENALADRLMALPEDEFRAEIKRLEAEISKTEEA